MEEVKITSLFDLTHTIAADYLKGFDYPWEALAGIKDEILALQEKLDKSEYLISGEKNDIYIHKTAKVAPTACINGPCIIGEGTEVRHCAFIRGSALVGSNAVVGNSTELKNVIIFDNAQVPHYNYVGDSILGYRAHMGAGSITSNVKSDNSDVTIKAGVVELLTGRRKVGAFLGDHAEIGCNSVLNPGTVIGKNTNVYPLSMVRGFVPESTIYKNKNERVTKQ
ncbi:MAG: UDP-N-acetylglucosamine pyrophosphorylase [Lachnospiraceae bacterium]|nr:UDP-N-acetylglucosamine pyrophosphorylase [Lachnospiraceae bacterium]